MIGFATAENGRNLPLSAVANAQGFLKELPQQYVTNTYKRQSKRNGSIAWKHPDDLTTYFRAVDRIRCD
ncbi:MAG: hypothetical protein Q7J45_04365 [bacterium]|nr:hypothetical protein [bacterium]